MNGRPTPPYHSLFLRRVEYARTGDGAPPLFHGGRHERLGTANGA